MELGLEGAPNLAWVLERPGVVRLEAPDPVEPMAPWPLLAEALGRALDELVARRTAEGDRLADALRTLHAELTAAVAAVAARAPVTAARREERLRERLRVLLAETAIDEARIVTEAAIWADKSDVTEELARLRAHLAEFTLLLDKGGPVGRPLDFLIQELNREVNTVASKADDLEMSQAALTAKSVLRRSASRCRILSSRAGARLGRRGTLFVVSAPSGAGKTTLCREARLVIPDLAYSVSATTRAPRPGEVNGVDFRFVSEREFRSMLERNELAEWATVHGNLYGPPSTPLEAALATGKDVLLDID